MRQKSSPSGATTTAAATTGATRGTLIAFMTFAFTFASALTAYAQPRMPTHVACVGDSITMGVGASSPQSVNGYPPRLQGLLGTGTMVGNFGHSGATLLTTGDTPYQRQVEYTAATTFVANAGADAVVDVIIMLGTNDSKPRNWMAVDGGTPAQQFATDLAALIDHFTSLPTHPVVYLALPLDAMANVYTISGPVIHDQIIPVINQVAADKGLPTIDLNTPTAGHPEYLVDGVHPNDGGYMVVAGLMRDGILRVPQVSITNPMADASVIGPMVPVSAEASGGTVAITSVEIFVDATSIGVVDQAPFSLSWSGVVMGSHALTATATDSTGAAATSDPQTVTVTASAVDNKGAGGGSGGCGCRIGAARGADAAAWGAGLVAAAVMVARRRRRVVARGSRRQPLK